MQLSEDDNIEKYAKACLHCNRITVLPHQKEITCISCGYIVIKRKHKLSKTQRKKNKLYQSIEKRRAKKFFLFVLKYINYLKVMNIKKYMKFYHY